jgi:hypothetical protein
LLRILHDVTSPDGGLEVYHVDDFDSLEAETQRSDDPMAYIPDVVSTTLTQRKFVKLSALMEAVKA